MYWCPAITVLNIKCNRLSTAYSLARQQSINNLSQYLALHLLELVNMMQLGQHWHDGVGSTCVCLDVLLNSDKLSICTVCFKKNYIYYESLHYNTDFKTLQPFILNGINGKIPSAYITSFQISTPKEVIGMYIIYNQRL